MQSRQSLAARGLPSKISHSKKKVQKSIDLSSESDQVGSVHVGLDRCASLLAAMLDSPTGTLKNGQKGNSAVKKTKTNVHKKPANKQLFSTPVTTVMHSKLGGSHSNQHDNLSSENNTVDELIEEQQKLKQYLDEIALDKHKIQETYQTIVQKHLGNFHQSYDESDSIAGSSRCSPPTAGKQKQLIHTEQLYPSKSGSCKISRHRNQENTISNSSMIDTGQSPPVEKMKNNVKLHDLMGSITKKLALEDKTLSVDAGTSSGDLAKATFKSPINTERDLQFEECHLSDIDALDNYNTIKETVDRSIQNDSVEGSFRTYSKPKSESTKVKYNKLNSNKTNMNHSKGHAHIHVTTLSYMLKELHTILGDKCDLEIDRLLNEIDHIVELLPFVINNSSSDFQVEMNLALQPLRQENVELRRKLRIANQQVKDVNFKFGELQQQAEDTAAYNQNASDVIEDLKHKLFVGEKNASQLSNQVMDVCKVMEELKHENQILLQSLSDKDSKQFEERNTWLNEKSTLENELARVQSQLEQNQMLLRTKTEELSIVEVTAKQKDTEIERLTKLNGDLQQSVWKLLREIHCERGNTQPVELHFKRELDRRTYAPVKKTVNNDNLVQQQIIHSTSSSSTLIGQTVDSVNSDVNGTLSTLGTYDNLDFQRDLDHLDDELTKIQNALKNTQAKIT